MSHGQPHDGPRSLLGAYVLDALDDEERAEVELLVLEDQDSRSELHALQLGAAWLARADGRPAPHVWDAISAAIAEPATVPTRGGGGTASVTALGARRRPHAGRKWRSITTAAAAVAALFVGLSVASSDSPRDVTTAALEAAGNPRSQRAHLAGSDDSRVEVVMLPSGRGYVLDGSLPRLADDRTYQLWAITEHGPVSAGVLGREPGPTEIRAPRGASALAVTAERRGGSDRPTGTVLAQGNLA